MRAGGIVTGGTLRHGFLIPLALGSVILAGCASRWLVRLGSRVRHEPASAPCLPLPEPNHDDTA